LKCSRETLIQGKRTFKDEVTSFMMIPYRFFQGNKILAPIFLSYAVIGGAISGASLATPISPAIIEGLALGGKILKIGCLPFLYPPIQFAKTKTDILKIQEQLCVNIKNVQFTEKMENAEATLKNIFVEKTIYLYFHGKPKSTDEPSVQPGGKSRRRRRNKRRFTRKHK
jgi:hypothetical protein